MSRAAARAISAGEAEARALGHGRLETIHLLLGLLDSKERSAASIVLGRRGVRIEALRAVADQLFEGPRNGRHRDLECGSGECREALCCAQDEADAAGSFEIAPVHLFLGATSDGSWTASRALAALGLDIEAARREAEALARDEAQGSLPEA